MAERTVQEVKADCERSLAELKALLEGKDPREEAEATLDHLMDMFHMKDQPAQRPAENY
jgi:hypothetical protein